MVTGSNSTGLRPQVIKLAEELGYTHNYSGPFGCDLFVRDGRKVEVRFTLRLDKITQLYVNDKRVQPAGKWPTIEALKAVGGKEETQGISETSDNVPVNEGT